MLSKQQNKQTMSYRAEVSNTSVYAPTFLYTGSRRPRPGTNISIPRFSFANRIAAVDIEPRFDSESFNVDSKSVSVKVSPSWGRIRRIPADNLLSSKSPCFRPRPRFSLFSSCFLNLATASIPAIASAYSRLAFSIARSRAAFAAALSRSFSDASIPKVYPKWVLGQDGFVFLSLKGDN